MSDKGVVEILESKLFHNLEKGLFKGEIRFDEPMSAYTSLRIGGHVEVMVFPEDPISLKNILIIAGREKIPVFVLGSGTNLLVRDGGVDGVAISLKAFEKIEFIPHLSAGQKGAGCIQNNPPSSPFYKGGQRGITVKGGKGGLFVEAGVSLNELINFTKKNGYSGIEALAGIPGTFGGAICMNAGSFGTEIKDVIVSVALMKMNGKIVIFKKDELKFSYRNSNIPEDTIILSANIVLKKNGPENVSKRIREFIKKKRHTQPIRGELSAGCVFKNPEGDSAGRLIDAAGCKGMRIGDVETSVVHANFFINKGRATCSDFMELMETVKARVKEFSGITLEPEIKIIGKDG